MIQERTLYAKGLVLLKWLAKKTRFIMTNTHINSRRSTMKKIVIAVLTLLGLAASVKLIHAAIES